MIKPAYSVSFLLSINIFVWQNVLYFLDAPRVLHPTKSVLQTSADTIDFIRCNSRFNCLHLLQLLRGTVVAIQNAAQASGIHFQHVAPFPELRTQSSTFKLGSFSDSHATKHLQVFKHVLRIKYGIKVMEQS